MKPAVIQKNEQILRDYFKSKWDDLSELENFKIFLEELVLKKKSATFYKFSDGERLWLLDKHVGSTSPGVRDSNLQQRNLEPFRAGVVQNDYLMCQLLNEHVAWFEEMFGKPFDFPVDYVYYLVASGWFTRTFNQQIGIIGAGPKLDLIRELCSHERYKDYLGFDGFTDYIRMPQRFMCDDIEGAELIMSEQLRTSKSSIFLVGIGHAQQALLHRMKKYKDAVYIVVGSGIDAYAGIQDNLRPYMGGWVNFQLSTFDYSKVDIWRQRFLNVEIL